MTETTTKTTKSTTKAKPARKKAKKASSAPKKEQAVTSARTGRVRLQDGMKIRILREMNPHRPGSRDHSKFEVVAKAGTWGEAKKAGIDSGYVRHAEAQGHLAIEAS